jgi:hypothetical protein
MLVIVGSPLVDHDCDRDSRLNPSKQRTDVQPTVARQKLLGLVIGARSLQSRHNGPDSDHDETRRQSIGN